MAQTIATQRGTGSGSQSGSATLFTQSGGNATRVIFNQFAAYGDYPYRSFVKFTMNHVVSNGSTNILGWYQAQGNDGTSFQLCPNPNGNNPVGMIGSDAAAMSQNGGLIGGSNYAYPGNSYAVYLKSPYVYAGISSVSSYAPQNFWIGAGDSVVINWAYGSYYSGGNAFSPNIIYAYHFTTITES
jgi:hypothetical protein